MTDAAADRGTSVDPDTTPSTPTPGIPTSSTPTPGTPTPTPSTLAPSQPSRSWTWWIQALRDLWHRLKTLLLKALFPSVTYDTQPTCDDGEETDGEEEDALTDRHQGVSLLHSKAKDISKENSDRTSTREGGQSGQAKAATANRRSPSPVQQDRLTPTKHTATTAGVTVKGSELLQASPKRPAEPAGLLDDPKANKLPAHRSELIRDETYFKKKPAEARDENGNPCCSGNLKITNGGGSEGQTRYKIPDSPASENSSERNVEQNESELNRERNDSPRNGTEKYPGTENGWEIKRSEIGSEAKKLQVGLELNQKEHTSMTTSPDRFEQPDTEHSARDVLEKHATGISKQRTEDSTAGPSAADIMSQPNAADSNTEQAKTPDNVTQHSSGNTASRQTTPVFVERKTTHIVVEAAVISKPDSKSTDKSESCTTEQIYEEKVAEQVSSKITTVNASLPTEAHNAREEKKTPDLHNTPYLHNTPDLHNTADLNKAEVQELITPSSTSHLTAPARRGLGAHTVTSGLKAASPSKPTASKQITSEGTSGLDSTEHAPWSAPTESHTVSEPKKAEIVASATADTLAKTSNGDSQGKISDLPATDTPKGNAIHSHPTSRHLQPATQLEVATEIPKANAKDISDTDTNGISEGNENYISDNPTFNGNAFGQSDSQTASITNSERDCNPGEATAGQAALRPDGLPPRVDGGGRRISSGWFDVPRYAPNHHVDPSPTLLQFDPRDCGEYHFLRDF